MKRIFNYCDQVPYQAILVFEWRSYMFDNLFLRSPFNGYIRHRQICEGLWMLILLYSWNAKGYGHCILSSLEAPNISQWETATQTSGVNVSNGKTSGRAAISTPNRVDRLAKYSTLLCDGSATRSLPKSSSTHRRQIRSPPANGSPIRPLPPGSCCLMSFGSIILILLLSLKLFRLSYI